LAAPSLTLAPPLFRRPQLCSAKSFLPTYHDLLLQCTYQENPAQPSLSSARLQPVVRKSSKTVYAAQTNAKTKPGVAMVGLE